MTLDQFQRAMLIEFAVRDAQHTGSIDCMRGVCYVLRNRVKAGWHDGVWLSVIEHAWEVSGNEPNGELRSLDINSRSLQILLRDVEDIFFANGADATQNVVSDSLYYQYIDRQPREWFTENIVRQPGSHPRRAIAGSIVFFD